MDMVVTDKGQGNVIEGAPVLKAPLTILMKGNNCRVVFEPNAVIAHPSEINFFGDDQVVHFHGDNLFAGTVVITGPRGSFEFGRGARTLSRLWMNIGEADDFVRIGEQCLLADVRFRTSDSHWVIDRDSGERLNPSAGITIGPRVWLAESVLCLRRTDVGQGSVVGARSMTNGPLPEYSLCVGQPARAVRSNITWR